MNLTAQLQVADVSLLAGSDCGPFSFFVYPVYSWHERLKLFLEACLMQ